ncbi:MAG: glycosyltransferase family 2 protein [Acidaminococcales bacterium]|nr:glycosyltransferase family 2 protein [Acidaminococcales bacterium]
MPKIILYTHAYNAERTIGRTIDSVIAQTHNDWAYYCLDNGSTDDTGIIIDEYAAKDPRIVALRNKANIRGALRLQKHDQQFAFSRQFDYFANLDADDTYEPGFFSEMLMFLTKHNLEIASCRSNFVDYATGDINNEYILERDLLISGEGFGTLFPEYFRFFGQLWGNLISCELLRRVDYDMLDSHLAAFDMAHCSDNVYMLFLLRYAKKAGILARLLHNYYISPNSFSQSNNLGKRLVDMKKRPELCRMFLREKIGYISDANDNYIIDFTKRAVAEVQAFMIGAKSADNISH